MAQNSTDGLLRTLSSELADAVASVAPTIVRVDDGSRLTATGLIWSDDGVIVTTSHGVERDEDLKIERADGTTLPATLVGRDPDTDLAVLRVHATGLPSIQKSDPTTVRQGNLTLALARPGRSGLHVTMGIISAKIETQTRGADEFLLHTDAEFSPGFSGGALTDVEGRFVGIINLLFGRGKSIALGLPIVAHAVDALLQHGRIKRGYLGIRTQTVPIPATLKQSLSLAQEQALLLIQVESGSAAEQGGLFMGDTLLAIDGHAISDAETLRQKLRSMLAGQSLRLTLIRGGSQSDLDVILGEEA